METSNVRAHEKEIKALVEFANLGDSLEAWQRFLRHWPDFFPAEFSKNVEAFAQAGWFNRHAVHCYQRMLRKVWQGNDPLGLRLGCLLGVYPVAAIDRIVESFFPKGDASWDEDVAEFEKMNAASVGLPPNEDRPKDVPVPPMEPLPSSPVFGRKGADWILLPSSHVEFNWRRGAFNYAPQCRFQEALYWLFQNSWRAKVCPQCGSYFVARRPPQRFCSTDCRDIVNRQAKLDYWREKGSARRAARLVAKQGSRKVRR